MNYLSSLFETRVTQERISVAFNIRFHSKNRADTGNNVCHLPKQSSKGKVTAAQKLVHGSKVRKVWIATMTLECFKRLIQLFYSGI